jgi:hypothetical protein
MSIFDGLAGGAANFYGLRPRRDATTYAELQPNPTLSAASTEQVSSREDKESRFGTVASSLWAVTTTAAYNGSVNAILTTQQLRRRTAGLGLLEYGDDLAV